MSFGGKIQDPRVVALSATIDYLEEQVLGMKKSARRERWLPRSGGGLSQEESVKIYTDRASEFQKLSDLLQKMLEEE